MTSFKFNAHGKTYKQLSKDRKAAQDYMKSMLEAIIKEQGKDTPVKDKYGNNLNYTLGEALTAVKNDRKIKPNVKNPIDEQLNLWKMFAKLIEETN